MDSSTDVFVQAARRYCTLVEDGGSANSWLFAQECLVTILELYRAALLLPEVAPDTIDFNARIEHELWDATRGRLEQKLSRDIYWEVFEPLDVEQPNPLCGSLSDDLSDIWRDVKDGLMVLDEDPERAAEVVWQWRFTLESHWGHHASGAICVLHALCFGPFADADRPTSAGAESEDGS